MQYINKTIAFLSHMNRILLSVSGLFLSLFSISAQDLVINELMTANASAIMDNTYYNYTEWVEIHNPTGQLKSLSGYYLFQ